MKIIKTKLKKGFGLVEVIVAIFIFTLILGLLITASNMYISGAGDNLKSAKAAYIAEEGMEAVKIIRDTGWNNISTLSDNTNYYLYFDTSSSTNNIWKATSTDAFVDSIFIRTFKTSPVYRDLNGRIVTTGGTFDTNSKEISVSVSWLSKNGTTTKTLSTYIANIL
jgi:prepilin-type N-terminal cleavage/methylation domain-containing protein